MLLVCVKNKVLLTLYIPKVISYSSLHIRNTYSHISLDFNVEGNTTLNVNNGRNVFSVY